MKKFWYCIIVLFLAVGFCSAQSKSSKVRQLEKQRREMLKNIEETSKQLRETQKNTRNEERRLQLVKKQVEQRKKMVEILDSQVNALQQSIGVLTVQEDSLKTKEDICKMHYANTIVAMQKRKSSLDRLLFIFSAKSFDEGVRRQSFLGQYAHATRQAAQELQKVKQQVVNKRTEIQQTRSQKYTALSLKEQEKKKLEIEQAQRSAEVTSLKSQQKDLKEKLAQQRREADNLNRRIERQIAAEIAEAERKAREEQNRLEAAARKKGEKTAPVQTKRKAETIGGYAMNAEERALSSNFAQNKGNLPVPVRGSYNIVGQFGVHTHSEHSRVRTNSGGIDYAVKNDNGAYCVFDGEVTSLFVMPGFNNSVIVRHGNYLTVYSNLISVNVAKGQRVKTGQKIGTIATDDNNMRVLNFQVWKERTKQNPAAWVR
ncbi:murein hydrolase activator EnvC family protein [Porphyromonas pogonae]|uniref:murein hydrolase activator EnvC family protein n=1 Tax=Porphyromonas pogonae TaxID=867595 RepID=UPI002E788FB7|nr:peptidoglycan DD-metalloendopeptidase family protein [Porphyromonas pogonae]